ncbi:hypothetical protein OTU49_007567 [Cherax quadricarinatus]|uniref:Galactosylgalactosylxylosylprotein 3-beta-glucuronosyltransferase n=3 Tax=Cherax quadricarinatus TaxID=27406 RepID=A0AAW0WVS8_CHEQU
MRKILTVVLPGMMMVLIILSIFGSPQGIRQHQNSSIPINEILKKLDRLEGRLNQLLDTVFRLKKRPNSLPTIYIVTPTYKRLEQIPELTRLAQTLVNVPNIHWIVADDTNTTNPQVIHLLKRIHLPYTYLLTPMPQEFKKELARPKGVANRNGGMEWIRAHATEGVLYFADDDNTYDIQIFEEMRYTRVVSMFPVGLLTEAGLSTPVLKDGRFIGWYDGWIGGRKFPVDMAGFAVSVPFLLTVPKAKMPYTAGMEETGFLSSLNITTDQIEFLADNCTQIYVWHTKTHKNNPASRNILLPEYNGTNLRILQEVMTIKEDS